MRSSNRIAATVATLSAIATAIALAAPQAGATVTSIRIERGQGFGSSESARGTGCAYRVIVQTDPGKEVVFLDEVDNDLSHTPFGPAFVVADASGAARTTWTPAKKGQHRVVVVERVSDEKGEGYSIDAPLTIGTGINVGPACVVLP
ncbi:hypothetical protein AB0M22_01030 [Nocardia sp. NPDC051756]|uniref:hypothetical protein n=1 Tax=Nocardia sp. NPDC051756 TaxID=3154751 RepID=UPI00342FBE72